jgi:hypothetical protein
MHARHDLLQISSFDALNVLAFFRTPPDRTTSGVGLMVMVSVHDGFLRTSHHPFINPFRPCPNWTEAVADSDVSQALLTTEPADRRYAGARVPGSFPRVHPTGALDVIHAFDHHQR